MPAVPVRTNSVRGALAWVAGRFRDRADREHEMVLNRLAISTLLMIYLVVSGTLHLMQVRDAIIADAVYGCISLGFFLHMLAWPQTSHARRIVGMCVDIGALTYCLFVGGATTAVLFPIYLWIIFGNGFRFGLRYLFAAMALAIVGFGSLLLFSDYWAASGHLGIGLLAGLLVLPAYTSTLIRNLSKAKVEAEKASKAKSLFLASVSHELRTPLNAVIGMSDLMKDSKLDAEQSDMLGTISGSARSLLSLIEDILDFSRIEAGRMRFQLEDFDLHPVLAEVKGMVEAQARAKGLRLGLHIAPKTPHRLRGDRRHLQEMLINLAGNAVKFTDRGSVTISADVVSSGEGECRLRFEVADTGIGIAPEAHAKIFESFTQADETIINRYGGTGLGLALCKRLAESLGGAIGVESAPGQGSTFWVEIGFAQRFSTHAEPRVEGLRAVVLTGDRAVLVALERGLSAVGVDVEFAATAADAERQIVGRASASARTLFIVDERTADEFAVRRLAAEAGPTLSIALLRAEERAEPLSKERRNDCLSTLSRPIDRAEIAAVANMALGQLARSGSISEAAGESRRSLSILIADDNRTNLKVLSKILERGGHRPRVVNNGEEAVDAMLASPFDIVFMDINMPLLNGIEATKLYRFAALGRNRVPIVALTADATPEARERCEAAGMDGCVTKPIESAELFRIIERLVPKDAGTPVERPVEHPVIAEISDHPRFKAEARALDPAAIERLTELGGTQFLAELAREFIKEGERILDEIRASVDANDCELFRDRLHALRSGAANIGALTLYEQCLALRGIGPAAFAEEGGAKTAEIAAEFERVRRELGDYDGAAGASAGSDASVIRPLRAAAGRTSGGSAPS